MITPGGQAIIGRGVSIAITDEAAVLGAEALGAITANGSTAIDAIAGLGGEPEGTGDLVLKGAKYSPEYVQKLQNAYKVFKGNGYDVGEHGLNRIFGRINQGKIKSVDQVLDVLETGTK